MKIKKFIKQHYRKIISLCLVLSVTALSGVTAFAYNLYNTLEAPIMAYNYTQGEVPTLSSDYEYSEFPAISDKHVLIGSNSKVVYSNSSGYGVSVGDGGFEYKSSGSKYTGTVKGLALSVPLPTSGEFRGYVNMQIRISSSIYALNYPTDVSFGYAYDYRTSGAEGLHSTLNIYDFTRFKKETAYWFSYYADNVPIPIYSNSLGNPFLVIFLQWNKPINVSDIQDFSVFLVNFGYSANPITIPTPEEEYEFPKDYETDDIKNGQAAEKELLDSQGAALDTGLGMISNAKSTLTNLASSFSFVSSFMNKLVKDNPFATLVTVSISLGIFGYLLNTFVSMDSRHRAVKARNEKKNNSKSKKGGD